mgnify:CR=1 FL=1
MQQVVSIDRICTTWAHESREALEVQKCHTNVKQVSALCEDPKQIDSNEAIHQLIDAQTSDF